LPVSPFELETDWPTAPLRLTINVLLTMSRALSNDGLEFAAAPVSLYFACLQRFSWFFHLANNIELSKGICEPGEQGRLISGGQFVLSETRGW
jgi:hypothetical protein